MNISSDTFQSIISAIKSDTMVWGAHNKRKFPRVGLSGQALIIPCSTRTRREQRTVLVRDLSKAGIGILHNEEIRKGEQFILCLGSEAGTRAILCTVARCGSVGDRLYSIGATFTRELSAVPTAPAKPASADATQDASASIPAKAA